MLSLEKNDEFFCTDTTIENLNKWNLFTYLFLLSMTGVLFLYTLQPYFHTTSLTLWFYTTFLFSVESSHRMQKMGLPFLIFINVLLMLFKVFYELTTLSIVIGSILFFLFHGLWLFFIHRDLVFLSKDQEMLTDTEQSNDTHDVTHSRILLNKTLLFSTMLTYCLGIFAWMYNAAQRPAFYVVVFTPYMLFFAFLTMHIKLM